MNLKGHILCYIGSGGGVKKCFWCGQGPKFWHPSRLREIESRALEIQHFLRPFIFFGPTRSTTLEIQWFSFPRANFPLIFAIFTNFEIWKMNFCLSPSGVNLFFSTHFPENRMVHPLETATGFLLKKPEYKMFFSSLPNVNFSYNQSKNDDYFIFLFSKPLKSKNNILK